MIETVILLFILFVGIIACELDSFVGGAITLLGLLGIAQAWFHIPVLAIITANPTIIVVALAVYVLVGVGYATLIRFPRYLASRQSQIASAWTEFKKQNTGEDATEEAFRASYRFSPFTAAQNDHRIVAWAMLWPWGLAWDAVNRPVRWMYEIMARACAGILARAERRAVVHATKKGP